MMTFKIFVHCDDDIRLCRRILRDVKERGRDPSGVLYQYNRFVKHSYTVFINKFIFIIININKNNFIKNLLLKITLNRISLNQILILLI